MAASASLDDLRARVEAHLSKATESSVTVASIEKLAGGACQDNYVLVLRFAARDLAGERKLVLRSDANTSLPGSLDRAQEYAVIRAAVAAGVRTPEARWPALDLVRPVAAAAAKALRETCSALGLMQADSENYASRCRERRLKIRNLDSADIDAKVAARSEARTNKDFALSDAIRAELTALGVEVLDATGTTSWRVLV